MSIEQAITDHASALRELASAIRATISGAPGTITPGSAGELSDAQTDKIAADFIAGKYSDKVISDAKKTATPAHEAINDALEKARAGAKPKTDTKVETKVEEATLPTYDEVKAKVLALAQAKGRDTLVDLLARHGVAKAPDLKETQYVDFLADIDAINAGTYDPAAAELA